MAKLESIVEENIARYAGAVLVNRALCDSRDMLKPSARTLIYSQIETSKNLPSKPYMKCARIVGDALGHWYTHGDSSCYGIYARLAKPFAMRYPLEDFHGNYGTLKASGNEAASRYTEIKLSQLGHLLFKDIEKNTIDDWENNFDETEKYPRVSTSRGFYNIVNGSTGIGYGAAAQIPQFNLKEVNEALIKLLWNPEIDAKEIICLPDYATGGIILNRDEVIESLLNGTGKACRIRSVIEYNNKTKTLHVSEIPYGVYSNTIREQIIKLLNENENLGIEGMNDMSAREADIEIYLSKNANPDKILKLLYKETSLEYYGGINFTMLKDGRFPKVFTWKEALQSYLDHQKIVYTRSYIFDLKKAKDRLHIVDGLIKALSIIDEVIALIKKSNNAKDALTQLIKSFDFSEVQAKAILDLKLSRLTHLDINKLTDEQSLLNKDINRLIEILNNEDELKKEIEKDLRDVAEKFGDDRRTKIIQLSAENDSASIEEKQLSLCFTNVGGIYASETSTLYSQRRNGIGTKFKLDKNEYIIDNLVGKNTDTLLFFTSHGNFYHKRAGDISLESKEYLSNAFTLMPNETIITATAVNETCHKKYIIFVTKNGVLKKSEFSEYNLKRNSGATAIKLDKDDAIVSVLFVDEEDICLASRRGQMIRIHTSDINAIGRVARGVCGMKLNDGDYIVAAHMCNDTNAEIISVSEDGYIKRSSLSEINITGRGTKGKKIQNTQSFCDFIIQSSITDVLVTSSTSQIRIAHSDIPSLGLGAQGVHAIKLTAGSKVIKLENI